MTGEEFAAAARLSAGDLVRARFLLSDPGRELRAAALGWPPAAKSQPWLSLLGSAKAAGEDAEDAARRALEEDAEAGIKRTARDVADAARRAGRRRRTEVLDLGLELVASWFRDLAAVAVGAEDVVFNRDRLDRLRSQAAGLDPSRPRRAVELVQETRRSLDLNVSEELALEALFFRLERLFG